MSADLGLWAAMGLSALWCAVHLFVGEREIAAPLRHDRTLSPVVRNTAFLCWHMVSVSLALMAVFFAMGALVSVSYAVCAVCLALGFVCVGLILPWAVSAPYLQVPQGWLFIPVVGFGLWGILG